MVVGHPASRAQQKRIICEKNRHLTTDIIFFVRTLVVKRLVLESHHLGAEKADEEHRYLRLRDSTVCLLLHPSEIHRRIVKENSSNFSAVIV